MCLTLQKNSLKTTNKELIFYKQIIFENGKIITPYQNFPIEVGKEYTLDTNLNELVESCDGEVTGGVFHLYAEVPEDNPHFFFKTTVKKGEMYLEGKNGDVGVTRVCYEYLNDEDKEEFENLLKISKNYEVHRRAPNGLYCVLKDRKNNFINKEGKLLSDKWFDWTGYFSEGFVWVILNGKYNFINTEGKLLSDKWFDDAWEFYDGFAKVGLDDKENFIDAEGKLLSDTWFDSISYFYEGFVWVRLNDKRNFINTEGKLISDIWFDRAMHFSEGFAEVELNDKRNFINTEGKLISDIWFDRTGHFSEGFAGVELNGEWKKIDKQGNIYDQYINF